MLRLPREERPKGGTFLTGGKGGNAEEKGGDSKLSLGKEKGSWEKGSRLNGKRKRGKRHQGKKQGTVRNLASGNKKEKRWARMEGEARSGR